MENVSVVSFFIVFFGMICCPVYLPYWWWMIMCICNVMKHWETVLKRNFHHERCPFRDSGHANPLSQKLQQMAKWILAFSNIPALHIFQVEDKEFFSVYTSKTGMEGNSQSAVSGENDQRGAHGIMKHRNKSKFMKDMMWLRRQMVERLKHNSNTVYAHTGIDEINWLSIVSQLDAHHICM